MKHMLQPAAVLAAPMIPRINDHELEAILAAAKEAGATAAAYILLRLPYEVKALMADWLAVHFPDRAEHVLSLLTQQRQGALNDSRFGRRQTGTGQHAELLAQRFRLAARKLGLNQGRDYGLDVTQFKPPPRVGDQLGLF